jgi:hypothetical protein
MHDTYKKKKKNFVLILVQYCYNLEESQGTHPQHRMW